MGFIGFLALLQLFMLSPPKGQNMELKRLLYGQVRTKIMSSTFYEWIQNILLVIMFFYLTLFRGIIDLLSHFSNIGFDCFALG